MGQDRHLDAALVLLGHGTALNPDSARPVYQHAAEVRKRGLFAEVREAFWKQDPQIQEVLSGLKPACVFIVPLFMSEGFFSRRVIPEALGFRRDGAGIFGHTQQTGGQKLYYCKPVGTHDSMAGVLMARAREVVERFPFPRAPRPEETTLFFAGHGTEQDENSRKAVERQVELVGSRNLYAAIHAVFLDEEPRIGACYQLAQTRNMIIVPFFVSDGLHTQQDIPVILGEPKRLVEQRLRNGQPTWRNPTERKGKLVWYSSSVGTHPELVEVILQRVRGAEAEERSQS